MSSWYDKLADLQFDIYMAVRRLAEAVTMPDGAIHDPTIATLVAELRAASDRLEDHLLAARKQSEQL